jgi:hypothetical protein
MLPTVSKITRERVVGFIRQTVKPGERIDVQRVAAHSSVSYSTAYAVVRRLCDAGEVVCTPSPNKSNRFTTYTLGFPPEPTIKPTDARAPSIAQPDDRVGRLEARIDALELDNRLLKRIIAAR